MATATQKLIDGPSVKLDPEVEAILKELGRAQTAYNEYGTAGRSDLQQGAHQYADQVRADASSKGFNLDGYGVKNQYGTDYTQYWTGGTAGTYDPTKTGTQVTPQPTTQATPAPAPAPAAAQAPQQAVPETNPLPSSTSLGQQVSAATAPAPIDHAAIQARAQNDANLQIELARQAANQNYGRLASESQSQIANLHALYGPQYEQNKLNTVAAAKSAVQNAANRGFFASGLSADAEMRANLAGERDRMALQGQENAQVGEIYNRLNRAGVELNDTLSGLAGREGQLVQSLIDSYTNNERGFDLQNRGLTTDVLLRLLGLNQSQSQFDTGLNWDMGKFGLQLGENAAQRAWQSGENQAQRDWTGQQNTQNQDWQAGQNVLDRQNRIDLANLDAQTRTNLQNAELAWRSGQADLDRADSQYRWQIETGLKVKWQAQEAKLEKDQFEWRKNESTADRETRVKAANSQWMAFADQALQLGEWKTYNQAVQALDSFAGRIMADGADMSGLLDYVRGRMGLATSQANGGKIPAGQPGNSNQYYSYYPNTSIGPANR